jgi:hypothetical protein
VSRAGRPVVRFANEVDERLHARRELLGVGGVARALLDDARHGAGVEVAQPLLARERGDEPRVQQVGRGIARHVLIEVRGDLEELGEVRIVGVQQVVEQALPHQHHLEVEGDGLGVERHRSDERELLPQRVDADLARAQRSLERLPGEGLGEQLQRIEDEVAAVRAVQHARLDQAEVGHERAHLRDVLDAADQRVVARLVLIDDRRAGGGGVLDQHVHRVAAEHRLGRLGLRHRDAEEHHRLAVLRLAEGLGVLEHVFLDLAQVVLHLRQRAVFGLQLLDQAAHRGARHLAVQGAQPAQGFAPPLRHLGEDFFQLPLERVDRALQPLLLLRRQLRELLGLHDPFAGERAEAEAARRAHERYALGARPLADVVQHLLLAAAELVLDLLAPVAVFVGFEGGRHGGAQVFHQPLHAGAERRRLSRRQRQRARPVRRLEVEDVAPVRGRRQPARLRLELPPHDGVAAEAFRAHGEKIVALAPHADAELDRAERARLAEEALQVLEVGGAAEGEGRRVAAAAELLGGQFHRPQVCARQGRPD